MIKDINPAGTGTNAGATLVYYFDDTAHTTANAATVTITAYGTNQCETVSGTFSGTAGSYTFPTGRSPRVIASTAQNTEELR